LGGEYLLCICDEEWCFCSNQVFVDDEDPRREQAWPAAPEVACEECKKGIHVTEPR
jgi:hypothetical protein